MIELSSEPMNGQQKKELSHWSMAHLRITLKCDILMNNLFEAFNKSILDARDKPVLTMLEKIRLYLMLLMASRRVKVDKWHGEVGRRIQRILEKNKENSQWCIPKAAGQNKFQVLHHSGCSFAVDLNAHPCSCNAWDLNGLPCVDACVAISRFHGNPEDYVDDLYKKYAYLRTYEPMIMPMTSEDQWMKTNLPPLMHSKYHKQPGKPKKSRNKAANEPKNSTHSYKLPRYGIPLKCGNCGEE